jgi:hypothetical protein
MTNKIKIIVLACLTMLVFPVFAEDEIHWMNNWDQSCYENGENTCRKYWYKTPQGSHLLKYF